jgi:hypothetical protein
VEAVLLSYKEEHNMHEKTPKDDWFSSVKDYLAGSYGFIMAISFGISFIFAKIALSLSPYFGNDVDPGFILLLGFGLPMAVSAFSLMAWARRWRKRRAEEQTFPRTPQRGR